MSPLYLIGRPTKCQLSHDLCRNGWRLECSYMAISNPQRTVLVNSKSDLILCPPFCASSSSTAMSSSNKSKKRWLDTVLDRDGGDPGHKSKKAKRNTVLDQDDEGVGTTSNASSAPSLVAAGAPTVGTSSAASESKQTISRTSKPSQPPAALPVSNEPTKQSKPEATRGASRPLGQRIREGAIIALSFASIISEATDLLKPVKAISGGIKKVLELTKVCDS
jgi:hypothetical protein